MTNEELVKKIKDGQNELMSDLWAQIEPFVNLQAYKFVTGPQSENCARAGVEREDLFCAGYFALEPAIRAFAPEKDFKFLTYFKWHLLKIFYKEIKVHKSGEKWYNSRDALAQSESIDKEIYEDKDGAGLTIADITPDEDAKAQFESFKEEQYNRQLRADLEEAISSLNPRDAQIIRDYYFNELAIEMIAQKLNANAYSIKSARVRALKKLQVHKALASYREEIAGMAYTASSFGAFKNTGASSTERIVMKLEAYAHKIGVKY